MLVTAMRSFLLRVGGTRLHVNDATMHGLESHQAEPPKPIDRFRFTSIEVQKLQNFFTESRSSFQNPQ